MENKYIKLKLLYIRKILSYLLVGNMLFNYCGLNIVNAREYSYYEQTSLDNENILFLLEKDFNLEMLSDGTLFVRSYKSKGILNVKVYSNQEFKNYLGIANPTFEDVKKVLLNNEYICEYFKSWIKEFLDNLEKINSDVDLCVFCYNLELLKIINISKDEMRRVSTNAIARFDARNKSILYVDKISKETFFHELTHMMSEAYMYVNEKVLVHKTLAIAIPVVDNKNHISIKYIYHAFLEGCTEILASSLSKRPIEKSGYKDYVNHILKVLSKTEIDIFDVFEMGTVNFINELFYINVENSLLNMEICENKNTLKK